MLSEQSAPVVRATLPAVGAAIGEIAELFYKKMFTDRPELLRDLFNRGNQAGGEQQQALAGSIAAFAGMLLEHPEGRPDALLSRIAHKHASLGITPSSTNSSTGTSSRPSSTSSATPSPRRWPPPGTRSTG